MNEIIENKRKIFNLIQKNPGVHISKIAEMTNLSIHEVEQFLFDLCQNKEINIFEESGYKQYFVKDDNVEDPSNKETWEKIYDAIDKFPGLHLSRIAELLDMSPPLAEYHLLRMEKKEKIISLKEKGYKRYYTKTEKISSEDKELLTILQNEILLKIVLFI